MWEDSDGECAQFNIDTCAMLKSGMLRRRVPGWLCCAYSYTCIDVVPCILAVKRSKIYAMQPIDNGNRSLGFPWTSDVSFGVRYQGVLWHYGGKMSWGPDNHIYLSLGDKYRADYAQDSRRYAGCIVRIAKNGTIPSGNLPSNIKPAECWAYGLRNPWAASWDLGVKGKERYLIAEVGGNDHKVSAEDVHLGRAGANYGWPYCEGHCDNMHFSKCNCNLHDDPIFSYPHNRAAQSIIGGHVYRGTQFPAKYAGAYFYADFAQQYISYLTFESDGSTKVSRSMKFAQRSDGVTSKPTGIVFDSKGSLWYLAQAPNSQRMEVWRISWSDPSKNVPPKIALASASTTTGRPPFKVNFMGAATDVDSGSPTLTWHFGDGTPPAVGSVVRHMYAIPGVFYAQLEASDSSGNVVRSEVITITSGSKPSVTIVTPSAGGDTFQAGNVVSYEGVASDTDDGDLSSKLVWNVEFLHDDHTHPYGEEGALVGADGSFRIPTSGEWKEMKEELGARRKREIFL